jgi:hypothetical protein
MAAPKQSGHMNTTDHAEHGAPSSVASQSEAFARPAGRSVLPLVDSVAFDPCPSRTAHLSRALSKARAVPASLALLGALALGSAAGVLGPAEPSVRSERDASSSQISWTELARVARMQLVAADGAYAPQALTGAASDLSPDGSDQGSSRSERMRARKEAAEARRAAARERREAAKQARLEARQARKEARLARKASREEDDEDEEESSSASDRREARRQAYAERRAAAKEKREAAAAARREALEERRSAYAERRAAAKEKRAEAAEARHAALLERREAAKARREEKLAARRAAREERLAAREGRSSRSEASPTVSSSGSFGSTETAMAPASGAALLRINSRPWAQVYVDGRLVGNTPQLGLQLPPGEHNVRLVNGVFAMGKVLNVKLRAGERVTRVEMLEE